MIIDSYKDCDKCKLCSTRTKIVWGVGPVPARIMLIGQDPGEDEDLTGEPFVGPAGQVLNECLNKAGIPRDQIYISNVTLCKSVKNKGPKPAEVKACAARLDEEIALVQPTVIIPAGNEALDRIMGFKKITSNKGKVFFSERYKTKVVPILHPSATLQSPGKYTREMIIEDLGIALAEATGVSQTKEIDTSNYITVKTLEEVSYIAEKLSTVPKFSFDIETTDLNFLKDKILGVGFCWKEGTGVYIPLVGQDCKEVWSEEEKILIYDKLKKVFELPVPKIAQNGSFDVKFLNIVLGCEVKNFYFDTMLAAFLIDENGSHGLKDLTRKHIKEMGGYESKLDEFIQREKVKSYDKIPLEIIAPYCCADVDATFRLQELFEKELYAQHLENLFYNLVMPVRRELIITELLGVRIDLPKLQELKKRYSADLVKLEEIIHSYDKRDWTTDDGEIKTLDINSPKQLGEFLFNVLKLPAIEKTPKGSPSTSEAALQAIKSKHPVIESILEYRSKSKLLSTFLVGMEELLDSNGRVHTDYNMHVARTGRLCVAGNTLLETNKGCFEISGLQLNVHTKCTVLSHEGKQQRILNKYYKGKEKMFKVFLEDGQNITCTNGHRFLTPGGWKSLYELKTGNLIYTYNTKSENQGNTTATITKIAPAGVQDVWDIEVEHDHSYCAQGFINHNSSSHPNLQNLPAESSSGIRELFIPEEGHKLLVCDYNQMELRILAEYSQDANMLDAFAKGEDIHTRVACQIFNVTAEYLDKLKKSEDPADQDKAKIMRGTAKAINFGLAYGRGPHSISEALGTPIEEAQALFQKYFVNFPGVKKFQDSTQQTAQFCGKVVSVFGRIRRLPDAQLADSRNPEIRKLKSHALRQALNAPIQGTAADCTELSTIKIMNAIREKRLNSRLILTVHDELVFSCPIAEVEVTCALIKGIMEHPSAIIKVPLRVDVVVCDNWGEGKGGVVPKEVVDVIE